MDRKAPLRPLAGLRCRRVRGFSDSFRRGILRSPHTAFLYEMGSINSLGPSQATFQTSVPYHMSWCRINMRISLHTGLREAAGV
jgi:hypothetical protein